MTETTEPKPSLSINLHDNKQIVTVSIVNGSSLMLDGKSVSELIQLLSRLRCQMEPQATGSQAPRPLQMLSDSTSQLVVDRAAQDPDSIVIGIFHPGPGWVGLSLDQKKASGIRDLIEYIAKLVPTH